MWGYALFWHISSEISLYLLDLSTWFNTYLNKFHLCFVTVQVLRFTGRWDDWNLTKCSNVDDRAIDLFHAVPKKSGSVNSVENVCNKVCPRKCRSSIFFLNIIQWTFRTKAYIHKNTKKTSEVCSHQINLKSWKTKSLIMFFSSHPIYLDLSTFIRVVVPSQ